MNNDFIGRMIVPLTKGDAMRFFASQGVKDRVAFFRLISGSRHYMLASKT
jgi:hypothetical protein